LVLRGGSLPNVTPQWTKKARKTKGRARPRKKKVGEKTQKTWWRRLRRPRRGNATKETGSDWLLDEKKENANLRVKGETKGGKGGGPKIKNGGKA